MIDLQSLSQVSLAEAARRGEVNASLPVMAAYAAAALEAARERVASCQRAVEEAVTVDERIARQANLKAARIAYGREAGIPVPEDTGLQYAGPAIAFVGGRDVTQEGWFQEQVRAQQEQIPKAPTMQQLASSPNGPPPGSVFVGDSGNWVQDWGQR